MPTHAPGHAENLVAGPEARHPRAGGHDRAGHVDAEDCRQFLPRVPRNALADFQVERIHAARRHADQRFACARDRPGDSDTAKRRAVCLKQRGLHRELTIHCHHSC